MLLGINLKRKPYIENLIYHQEDFRAQIKSSATPSLSVR